MSKLEDLTKAYQSLSKLEENEEISKMKKSIAKEILKINKKEDIEGFLNASQIIIEEMRKIEMNDIFTKMAENYKRFKIESRNMMFIS